MVILSEPKKYQFDLTTYNVPRSFTYTNEFQLPHSVCYGKIKEYKKGYEKDVMLHFMLSLFNGVSSVSNLNNSARYGF